MKQYICFLSIFLFGCGIAEREETKVIETVEQNQKEVDSPLDTILEQNNPQVLDLTKHQLFIDTTRNSDFYGNLINWKPNKYSITTVDSYIRELNNHYKYQKYNFGDFPKLFIRINQFKEKFYLYDRCDGIDQRFELRDSAFIFYGPLEPDAETIRKVNSTSSRGIKLELNAFKAKTSRGWSSLEILKTEYDGIYSMKYKNENYEKEEFVISIADIKKYDLVVNHCPNMKRKEFDLFY